MSEQHPTQDDVIGAFGDAFCLLVRYLDENSPIPETLWWAQARETQVVQEIRDVMEAEA